MPPPGVDWLLLATAGPAGRAEGDISLATATASESATAMVLGERLAKLGTATHPVMSVDTATGSDSNDGWTLRCFRCDAQ